MKKLLYLTAAFAALAILSRQPHPAQDIADLDPVQTVYIHMEEGRFHIQTDTGDHGSGESITTAETDLRANASKEVYLDTAEFLILDPDVPLTADLFTILHPDCRVCLSGSEPDLATASAYLTTHTPTLRLAHLREKIP